MNTLYSWVIASYLVGCLFSHLICKHNRWYKMAFEKEAPAWITIDTLNKALTVCSWFWVCAMLLIYIITFPTYLKYRIGVFKMRRALKRIKNNSNDHELKESLGGILKLMNEL